MSKERLGKIEKFILMECYQEENYNRKVHIWGIDIPENSYVALRDELIAKYCNWRVTDYKEYVRSRKRINYSYDHRRGIVRGYNTDKEYKKIQASFSRAIRELYKKGYIGVIVPYRRYHSLEEEIKQREDILADSKESYQKEVEFTHYLNSIRRERGKEPREINSKPEYENRIREELRSLKENGWIESFIARGIFLTSQGIEKAKELYSKVKC